MLKLSDVINRGETKLAVLSVSALENTFVRRGRIWWDFILSRILSSVSRIRDALISLACVNINTNGK